jgi:SAM-dependent methyltransferase
MQQWNEAFKKQGKIFTEVQADIPNISQQFKKHGVRRILDLGFGSGRHVVYLAGEGFDVYGIDIAREGKRITTSWLQEKSLKANLRIGNIYEKLPYPNDFFDAIISVQVLHHSKIGNIRKLIKEIERILKPLGLLFVTVPKKMQRDAKTIAPRTYLPLEGLDKGMIHYIFNKRLLRKEFSDFRIERIWVDPGGQYCFLGKLEK